MLKTDPYEKYLIKKCRICASPRLYKFLDLGAMPTPNGYLEKKDLKKIENRYPLSVGVCQDCFLVQLTHVVPSEIMFSNYLYIPSTSKTLMENFQSICHELLKKYPFPKNSLIVDIGSNDGTLLSFFKENEMRVLGVDPATNLVSVARLKGIETMNDFFNSKSAIKIVQEYGKAKLITSTNSFAHLPDPHDICEAIKILLDKDGVAFLQFPYLIDMVDKNEFDTIYHEHLSYLSVMPLTKLFAKHGLEMVDIIHTPIHGGSLKVFISHKNSKYKKTSAEKNFITEEKLKKLDNLSYYQDFSRRIKTIRRDLVSYLKRLKKQHKKIVGYGASAKGNILLNYCGLDTRTIDYIVDSIPYKQGRFAPGSHLPIYPESRLLEDQPDYALLFAWTFMDEILEKQRTFRERGGRFIITIPYLRIE